MLIAGGNPNEIIPAASGIEVMHLALVHDDIIDRAETRRERESVYHKYGLDTAILTGDLLINRAYEGFFKLKRPIPSTSNR